MSFSEKSDKNNRSAIVHKCWGAVDISVTDFTLLGGQPFIIYVGGSGDIKVDVYELGTGVTFSGVPVGFHPVYVTKVYKTGTLATSMLACQ